MDPETATPPQEKINQILGQTVESSQASVDGQPAESNNPSIEVPIFKSEGPRYQDGSVALEITRTKVAVKRQETTDTVTFNNLESLTPAA